MWLSLANLNIQAQEDPKENSELESLLRQRENTKLSLLSQTNLHKNDVNLPVYSRYAGLYCCTLIMLLSTGCLLDHNTGEHYNCSSRAQ